MMPSPTPGASHGDTNEAPQAPDRAPLCHLTCSCQLHAQPRRMLCGVELGDGAVAHACRAGGCHSPCVVCLDLGRSVLVARRCERCPT